MSLKRRIVNAFKALRGFNLYDDAAVDAFGATGAAGRLLNWATQSVHPDDDLRTNMRRVRARARDLATGSPYVVQFLNLLAVNVIGHKGFQLNSQVRSSRDVLMKPVNDSIEDAWEQWACSPVTVDGKMNLTLAMQALLTAVARDGEAFVRLWIEPPGKSDLNDFGFGLELIDPDLVDETYERRGGKGENDIRLGVEVNKFGRPVNYYAWSEPEQVALGGRRVRQAIPASDMLHLYLPKRLMQTRGQSWLYPVMVPMKMLDGYVEAELVAARTAAAKMGFIKSQGGEFTPPPPNAKTANTTQKSFKAAPGTIDMLPPGLDFVPWDPTHPTSAFPNFVKAVMRSVATGLGVSYNALANDLEGVNYSSMRSGLLIERDIWRALQEWWVFSFLRPVYEQWLNVALLRGDLQVGSRDFRKYRRVQWTPRGWTWVDPLKDAQAAAIAIGLGMDSRQRLMDEQGIDFDETIRKLKDEKEAALEADVDISGDQGAAKVDPGTESDQTNAPAQDGGGNGNGNGKAKASRLAPYVGGAHR